MPVETSAPVTGQTKTSVPMVPSVTRPAQEIETAIEHAVQEASHATQYARRATQYACATLLHELPPKRAPRRRLIIITLYSKRSVTGLYTWRQPCATILGCFWQQRLSWSLEALRFRLRPLWAAGPTSQRGQSPTH